MTNAAAACYELAQGQDRLSTQCIPLPQVLLIAAAHALPGAHPLKLTRQLQLCKPRLNMAGNQWHGRDSLTMDCSQIISYVHPVRWASLFNDNGLMTSVLCAAPVHMSIPTTTAPATSTSVPSMLS